MQTTPNDSKEAAAVNGDYYGRLSAGRDDYWRKMAAPRFRVATFLSLLEEHPAGSLLDIGCGNGTLLAEIGARHPRMALGGVDLSEAQVAANRQSRPAVSWYAADLDRPLDSSTLPPSRFDVVVASEIIEHVCHPDVFLRNALQLAAQGGRLLLSTQSGPVRETERRVGHVRHFTVREMTDLLEQSGWQPQRVWNAGFPFHDLSKWYANLDPDASMRQFGESHYGWKQDLVCSALRVAFRFNSSHRGAQLFAVARKSA
jgi:cyclopropane fatty-acyl-phospholipid synthase-like methyltransferase